MKEAILDYECNIFLEIRQDSSSEELNQGREVLLLETDNELKEQNVRNNKKRKMEDA
jgi:hypothetical protein